MADSTHVIQVGETFDALVAFTDLTKFNAYAKDRAPETIADLIHSVALVHQRIVGESPGRVVKYLGDTALLVFPGDAADSGVRILLALTRAVEQELVARDCPCRLSSAAHYGSVIGVQLPPITALDVMGEAANIAATRGRRHQQRGIPQVAARNPPAVSPLPRAGGVRR